MQTEPRFRLQNSATEASSRAFEHTSGFHRGLQRFECASAHGDIRARQFQQQSRGRRLSQARNSR